MYTFEYEALTAIDCLEIAEGDKWIVNQLSRCGSHQHILSFKKLNDSCSSLQEFFSDPLDIGEQIQQGNFLVTRLN